MSCVEKERRLHLLGKISVSSIVFPIKLTKIQVLLWFEHLTTNCTKGIIRGDEFLRSDEVRIVSTVCKSGCLLRFFLP